MAFYRTWAPKKGLENGEFTLIQGFWRLTYGGATMWNEMHRNTHTLIVISYRWIYFKFIYLLSSSTATEIYFHFHTFTSWWIFQPCWCTGGYYWGCNIRYPQIRARAWDGQHSALGGGKGATSRLSQIATLKEGIRRGSLDELLFQNDKFISYLNVLFWRNFESDTFCTLDLIWSVLERHSC